MDTQISLRRIEGIPGNGDLQKIAGVEEGTSANWVRSHLEGKRKVLVCVAEAEGRTVGYKIGYEERPYYFESWLGAVAPDHRRKGIARALLEQQHEWCRAQGFRIVSTTTEGDNRAMLIANLQAGFEVCGTFWDRRKILKVILQKPLPAAPA